MSDMPGIEAPDADTAEQERDLLPELEDFERDAATRPLEADQADSAEQDRDLGVDDDEYR
jgi:hypothetical protein